MDEVSWEVVSNDRKSENTYFHWGYTIRWEYFSRVVNMTITSIDA